MNSSDDSRAVVELPDDAIDAECEREDCQRIAATASDVYCEITGGLLSYPTYDARTVLSTANEQTQKLVDEECARVRAEAVAAERQRWERLVRAHLSPEGVGGPDQAARNSVLQRVLAAGSVPVATPTGDPQFAEAFISAVLEEPVGWAVANLNLTVGDIVEIARWLAPVAQRAGRVPVATPPRPEIVVLCGSTRFKDAFREAARSEALAGRIVLTVSDLDPRPEVRHVNVPIDAETKARLDELHKRKIDLADRVLVLNVGGYVGESTRSEIEYATALGKQISYLEPCPVATPTEPPYVDLLAILHQDDCEHGNMPEVCARCDGGSPVPAEPPRKALTGWFDVTEVPAEQPETPESDVRGTAHGSGIFGDLEASSAPDPVRRSPRFRNRPGQPRTPRMRGAAEQPEER